MSSPYRESKWDILKSLLIYIAMFLFLGVMTEVRQMRQYPLSTPVHPIR
jgi:hypothetical protein